MRLSGVIDDPFIQVQPGVQVRESSLRGFRFEGVTYYYYLAGGAANVDPLSSGKVVASQVEVVIEDTSGPQALVIYRIMTP